MIVGHPGRSAPVDASSACIYQCGCCTSGPSFTLAVKYTVPVLGSYVGVAVEPTLGVRSPQPIADVGQAGPKFTLHLTAPVVASSPYALLFSVATITVEPTTMGCPYTWPSTAVENNWPKLLDVTWAGARPGSFVSEPVRSVSTDTVVSSAKARDPNQGAKAGAEAPAVMRTATAVTLAKLRKTRLEIPMARTAPQRCPPTNRGTCLLYTSPSPR